MNAVLAGVIVYVLAQLLFPTAFTRPYDPDAGLFSWLNGVQPDGWTNTGFANGGHRYTDGVHSAHAGEELPIAKVADGIRFRPGPLRKGDRRRRE